MNHKLLAGARFHELTFGKCGKLPLKWRVYVSGTAAGIWGKYPLWVGWVLLYAGTFTACLLTLPGRSRLAAARATNWFGGVWESCASQTNVFQVRPALAKSYQCRYHVPSRPWCQRPHWMPKEEGEYCLQIKMLLYHWDWLPKETAFYSAFQCSGLVTNKAWIVQP